MLFSSSRRAARAASDGPSPNGAATTVDHDCAERDDASDPDPVVAVGGGLGRSSTAPSPGTRMDFAP